MSPTGFHYEQKSINGPRPSPLKINKESHFIHKSSSSSSSNSSSSISVIAPVVGEAKQQRQRNQPVIIYTHSPKVIHTQARDFMALVQKLTGLSRSKSDDDDNDNDDHENAAPTQQAEEAVIISKGSKSKQGTNNSTKYVGSDDNESSSVLTDENYGNNVVSVGVDDNSPILKPPKNSSLADIPLFTPTSTNLFCSPWPLYRYPDSVFSSPNMGNSVSPSVLEFLKGLPE